MKSVVFYASRKGNTRLVAEAIAERLRATGAAEVVPVDGGSACIDPGTDFIAVGGPTEGHGMTEAVGRFLDGITPVAAARAAAAFDTRVNWPRLLSGAAADGIAKRLQSIGARLVMPPESFIVSTKPELLPGELDRARAWGASLAQHLQDKSPTATRASG
jgi:flavodoxin